MIFLEGKLYFEGKKFWKGKTLTIGVTFLLKKTNPDRARFILFGFISSFTGSMIDWLPPLIYRYSLYRDRYKLILPVQNWTGYF